MLVDSHLPRIKKILSVMKWELNLTFSECFFSKDFPLLDVCMPNNFLNYSEQQVIVIQFQSQSPGGPFRARTGRYRTVPDLWYTGLDCSRDIIIMLLHKG